MNPAPASQPASQPASGPHPASNPASNPADRPATTPASGDHPTPGTPTPAASRPAAPQRAQGPRGNVGEPTRSADGRVIQWTAPRLVEVTERTTIPSLLAARVGRSADRPFLAVKDALGTNWRYLSAAQFSEEVERTAAGLIGLGLEAGARVAIMSRTRYEWTLLDYSCWAAGLVPVPIYETSSGEQIEYIVRDADVRAVVTETTTQLELARAACQGAGLPQAHLFSLDTDAIDQIQALGADVPSGAVAERTAALTTASLATIVYTSGTTGRPKGTVITHGNFTDLAVNSHAWMPEVAMGQDSRLLLFLPLAHVFARFLQVFQLSGEGILGHTPDTKNLLADLATFKPSYLLAVPRVLEKIYNSADAKTGGGLKQKLFRWSAKVAIAYSRALEKGPAPASLRIQRAIADRLVYAKIRALVGGNARFIISGGAPLSTRLAHFYTGLGLPVLEGYGLTETVGPLSVNTPSLSKIGTVGPALPPLQVRISDDGEILIKGPSVFQGYHNAPEATAAAFTQDGWFRTGDLGSLDSDGYVRITGRAKEIIVTAGGKNVAPAALEDPLRGHPLISQVVVVGDQRPFVAALVTLDEEMLPGWLKNHGLPAMPVTEAATHPEVLAALDRAVERANKHVSRAEAIRKIKVLTTDFTEANGLLTPSLKVKRAEVMSRFAAQVDEIYGGPVRPAGEEE